MLSGFSIKRSLFKLTYWANRAFCRLMYGINHPPFIPLPKKGPALIVVNHSSFSDPLVVSASIKKPITFLVANEIFQHFLFRWIFQKFNYVPVKRGSVDSKAVRELLARICAGEFVGVFPHGGIDEYRREKGYPGIGYLALKTGIPVFPIWIEWEQARPLTLWKSLCVPCRATIKSGPPLQFSPPSRLKREMIDITTSKIMNALSSLCGEK